MAFTKISERGYAGNLTDVYGCFKGDTKPTDGFGNFDSCIEIDPAETDAAKLYYYDADTGAWVHCVKPVSAYSQWPQADQEELINDVLDALPDADTVDYGEV